MRGSDSDDPRRIASIRRPRRNRHLGREALHPRRGMRARIAGGVRPEREAVDPADGADAGCDGRRVDRCPSGALHVAERRSLPSRRRRATPPRSRPDGPTYLRGDLALHGAGRQRDARRHAMALCRCGASQNKPYCDGSHAKIGFRHAARSAAGERPAAPAPAVRFAVRARQQRSADLTGPATRHRGRTAAPRSHETTFLCRCGESRKQAVLRRHAQEDRLHRVNALRPSASHPAPCRSSPTSPSTARPWSRASADRHSTACESQNPFVLRTAVPPIGEAEGRRVDDVRRLGKRIVLALEDGRFPGLPPDDRRSPALARARREAAGAHHTRDLRVRERHARVHRSRHETPRVTALRRAATQALAAFDAGGLEVLETDVASFRRAPREREPHVEARADRSASLRGIGNAYSDEILHRARLSPIALTA